MLIVLDNVLDESQRSSTAKYFLANNEARKMTWTYTDLSVIQNDNSILSFLIKKASKFFDLTSMIGCECWAHFGTYPGMHIDKDEVLQNTAGKLAFPLCSIVYYADIDVIGGMFFTETISVKPITNRLVIFSPGILHGVEPYRGRRLSIAINPWANKPMGYI